MWASDLSPGGSATRLSAVLAVLLASLPVAAQPAPVITDEDLARVRRETPTVTEDDVRRIQQQHSLPVTQGGVVATPRIDALPKPRTSAIPNLGDIAHGYAQRTPPTLGIDPGSGPGLFVFVSLAMPEPTLMRLVDQAARAKAAILGGPSMMT